MVQHSLPCKIAGRVIGIAALLASIAPEAYADQGLFYEYRMQTLTPKFTGVVNPPAQTFGINVVGIFDTTESFDAAMRASMRREARKHDTHAQTSDTSAWEEMPVANDGNSIKILWSNEGAPWSNVFSASSASTSPSMLGLELESIYWAYPTSFASFGINWNTNYYFYDNIGGIAARATISMPVVFSVSTKVLPGLIAYANFGVGPLGYLKGWSTYDQVEAGLNYSFADSFRASLSYRLVNDYLTRQSLTDKYGKYHTSNLSLGIGWYF
ncbi:MAG: hypothetical protein PHH36_00015 [Sideroxydans sp.]|nr:hypothetical protein [Sideroxydans sp.]